MNTFKWATAFVAGFLLLVLSTSLYAATCREIESALESAREDLRISITTEERIISDLAKLKKSGDTPPDIIKDYELYLHRVHAMVDEKRRLVGRMEALSAKCDVHKTPDRSTGSKDTSLMTNPVIPEEQVVDEVDILDRRLDGSLSEFDEMLLKELDLIQAKSSKRMRDLAEEAAAAAERLRNKGIDITADVEGESTVSAQEKTEKEKSDSETGKENTSVKGKDDTRLTGPDKTKAGTEGSRKHPKNRYNPKDDDIVARQLREAAEEETDPGLREKLWKEYEHYKKNTGE